MECVILYRANGGEVGYVADGKAEEEWKIAVYPNMDAAVAYADKNALFQSGQANYQIVELSEL